jgi:uncharacterized hydrophobic protein (TIGR00271 family)
MDTFDEIHQTIEKELSFRGTNLWILVFAILIASVGLNMNSTPVVIGAMLISPLMGPINGMGYSIATYNFPLWRRAARNFTFSVFAGLMTSTTYFAISPISTAHSEILARTSPTIYDVLIAFFGGLAGIVALISRTKGNVIPGVAIATALMPPLCTAGYGLATGQMKYFFGAMYLFTINTVFIGLAALLVSQIFKLPISTVIDAGHRKKINQIISFVIFIVLIPSIYLGYRLVEKEAFTENAKLYVEKVSILDGNYLLESEINANTRSILLVYGGLPLSDEQKESILDASNDFALDGASINLHDGFSFELIDQKNSELKSTDAELNRLSLLLKEKNKVIDSINRKNLTGQRVLNEIKALYPQITRSSYAVAYTAGDTSRTRQTEEIFIFDVQGNKLSASDKARLEKWLTARQNSKKIRIYYE